MVNLHEVTEREQAMRAIVYERNTRQALVDSTTDMIWSVDRDLNLITANRWFLQRSKELSGHDAEPGSSVLPIALFSSYDSNTWRAYYERTLAGESVTFEAHGGGSTPEWGEFNFNPIREGDVITGVACACRNITERKRAEEDIRTLNTDLEARVLERTRQLVQVNEELARQAMDNQRLGAILELRNQDLMDSIGYARYIQNALLPTTEELPFFTASACLSIPRDVLSGDFLWYHQTPEHVFLAVVDCTGHGVPGALMSVLGNNLLDQFIVQDGMVDPAIVLARMDASVNKLFGIGRGPLTIQDGMDAGLVVVRKADLHMQFAGAMLRCHVLHKGAMKKLEPTRACIGGHSTPEEKHFTKQLLHLEPGDRIVLASDGYRSQFGGPKEKKLNTFRCSQLLTQSAHMTPSEAIEFLDSTFHAWKGHFEQTDDVMVVMADV